MTLPPKTVEIIVRIEQPWCRKSDGWQVAAIAPITVENITISSIVGVTPIKLSRFMRVKVKGIIGARSGKYQILFSECEEAPAEYKNPIATIMARAGVPKARHEILQIELGEDYAKTIAADPSHIRRLFPRIKKPGTKAIRTSCEKAVAGNEIFQALNAVGAPQKTIDAASAFDLEKQSVYDLIERGLPFARADALAQHPAIQALRPFDRHDHARIGHATLVQVKDYCGLWGHTGLPLPDVLDWLGKTYALDRNICREALILGAHKRGLHIDDGANSHIFLADHFKAEQTIFNIVQEIGHVRQKIKCALAKSARIMVGSADERRVFFSKEQLDCLAGLIECKLGILTGTPGTGKSTLITALNDHYEGLLVVALAAKAALRAHEISGANHATIEKVLRNLNNDWDLLEGIRVLVIEEASMVGSIQMATLMEAAMERGVHKIILVGDRDQLDAIDNGSPFADLIRSGKVPVFRLMENHRTNPASLGIVDFCQEILGGKLA